MGDLTSRDERDKPKGWRCPPHGREPDGRVRARDPRGALRPPRDRRAGTPAGALRRSLVRPRDLRTGALEHRASPPALVDPGDRVPRGPLLAALARARPLGAPRGTWDAAPPRLRPGSRLGSAGAARLPPGAPRRAAPRARARGGDARAARHARARH